MKKFTIKLACAALAAVSAFSLCACNNGGDQQKETTAPTAAETIDTEPLTKRQTWTLVTLALTVVTLIIGVTRFEWYMPEITGLFLAMGIICGIIAGFSANRISDELLAGAKDILPAALVVGVASGIIVILQDGRIIDSILHSLQEGLDGTGPLASLPFYLWVGLIVILIARTVRDLYHYQGELFPLIGLFVGTMIICLGQFLLGRYVGSRCSFKGAAVTAGQSLGQKNSALAIWMTQSWLNPLAALAPAAYIIWQNLFNSWQLVRAARERKSRG